MVSVLQYQTFCDIPSGSTINEYYLKIAELNKWNVSGLTTSEIQTKVSNWKEKLVMSKKIHTHVRLGGSWYLVDRELYELAFLQWINFDREMNEIDETKIHSYIHSLISVFLRKCRVYKYFPKKFNEKNLIPTSKIVQEKMDISVALELVNFFLDYTKRCSSNTRIEFLERLDREMWVKIKD